MRRNVLSIRGLGHALVAFAAIALCSSGALAQMKHQHNSEAACEDVALKCASKVTATFDAGGTLWAIWMAGGQLSVASSADGGKTFPTPVVITKGNTDLDWGPDARPQIVVDPQGRIVVAFSTFRDKAFNGEVFTTRSVDGGKTFAPPQPITASKESQRFQALALDRDGSVFAAWLDKRNRGPARKKGEVYDGAALFFASSKDGGATYSEAHVARDNTCECCRLGLAFAGPGRPAVVFRNIFEGGVRGHAIVTFSDLKTPGEIHRVSVDDWKIAACPHHGPSLEVAKNGTYHVTWYTNGKNRKGLFYARSEDGGRSFSTPMPIGDAARAPSRPFVLAGPDGTQLVWKEFDGETTTVHLMTSRDAGKTWSQPRAIASTADASDHPLLVSDGRKVFLSWMTKADGYRFQALEGGS